MATFRAWTRTTDLSRSGRMDRPGLCFIVDCNHKAWFRVFLLVSLFLEASSILYFLIKSRDPDDPISKEVFTQSTLSIMHTFHKFCGMFCTFAAIFWLAFNQNKLQRVTSDLNKMRTHLNIDRSPNQSLKEWFVVFGIFFTFNLIYLLLIIKDLKNAFNTVPYLLNLTLSYVLSGQVSCLFLFVKSFYGELMQSKKYEETVMCAQKLSKIVDNICQLYKLPILLITSWLFLLAISNIYFLLYKDNRQMFIFKLMTVLGVGVSIYPIILIIRSCNGLSQQVKKFNEHLYWVIVNDESRQLLDNERLDLHFIMTDEMAFTACDFFPIDNSLICSMISTATTYLVILLQYGKNDPSSSVTEMNATLSD